MYKETTFFGSYIHFEETDVQSFIYMYCKISKLLFNIRMLLRDINPLPVLFKSLLHGQRVRFVQWAFNLHNKVRVL
jgi:hypothetical protein